MKQALRDRFDSLLENVLAELPDFVREQLDEVPVIVEDEPNAAILEDMGLRGGEPSDLCGLHSGIPLTERSPTAPSLEGSSILIFRGPILRLADGDESALEEEIRITLLHEIGHHFGFSEEELEAMGYG
jgi:predicted Zn-dependent protease with MMP-like domain